MEPELLTIAGQFGLGGFGLYLLFRIFQIQQKTFSCHLTDLHKDNVRTHNLLEDLLRALRK
ncbi:hypothetical protein NTE_03406 [Candidatus Nitrososphaera evergladensis SR1]|uniref:Uncharacterized protein n=1 Tax=Candidatus Nitrososphaera evergladensis SR1 TaxID=1459636 RepID=A0A075N1V2_9ARCH|nr:hypothetical protein [Candidatus Nitrososphaera evergladensis]AIF85434.1 hypothetical protein NTE_03406 [Candidatus Nitrososphaera evergladensis SR1]